MNGANWLTQVNILSVNSDVMIRNKNEFSRVTIVGLIRKNEAERFDSFNFQFLYPSTFHRPVIWFHSKLSSRHKFQGTAWNYDFLHSICLFVCFFFAQHFCLHILFINSKYFTTTNSIKRYFFGWDLFVLLSVYLLFIQSSLFCSNHYLQLYFAEMLLLPHLNSYILDRLSLNRQFLRLTIWSKKRDQ